MVEALILLDLILVMTSYIVFPFLVVRVLFLCGKEVDIINEAYFCIIWWLAGIALFFTFL